MKTGLLYLGLVLSVLAVGMAYGSSEPEGVPWAEWRFSSDFDGADEISADKSSDPDSLMRRNPATSEVSISGGKVVFTQTGPDDFLRADVEDLAENGGGGYVNEYTMIFDVKAMDADWLPIYNTGYNNYNAAELWVAADGSVGSGAYSDPGVVPLNTWVRLVVVRRLEDNSWVRDLYVDGTNVFDNLGAEGVDGNASLYTNAQQDDGQFTIISDSDATAYAGCELDNFAFVAVAMSDAEVADLGRYNARGIFGITGLASEPSPADEATDVLRDTTLSWIPAETAKTHDVYFGADRDDVNDASRADAMGVLLSQDQAGAMYDPGRLEFGQTYYWRIDEVNGAPDYTVFTGNVWSFTVEPFAYPIANVTVTSNAVSQDGTGPENTVNGSGLDAEDQHSIESGDMWLASPAGADPMQIEYAFDRVYKLYDILVWNYNVQFEPMLGLGIKNVTVEYSEDGATWMSLGDVELAQATASPDYVANTSVDMAGVAAQYVRLTVNSGFGTTGKFGLSEIRFLSIPAHARIPEPADGATDVNIDTALNWRAGREAASHEVYFGMDPDALPLAETVDTSTYTPSPLDLATTYHWRIDEVNEAEAISAWQGDLWSFSTQEYIIVDDFESYNDDDHLIYDSWLDGWVNETGSTVGYFEAPFAETTIVHGGSQAMPLFYDNTDAAVSEADLELSQDWTTSGIRSLSLYFHGDPDNSDGQLYIKINDTKVAYNGAATDITEAMWLPWNIDLSAVGGNLSSVTSLTIGIEGAGASGIVYIDDIRLYPQAPEFIVPTEPDTANLVALYAFEGDLSDSAGSHPGTAMGDAQTASDPARGQVLSLDGDGDAVDVAYSAELNPAAFTASLWANPDPAGTGHRSPITSRDDGPQRGYIIYVEPGNTWQFWTGTGAGWDNTAGPAAALGEWTHVAASYENEQKMFYINGRLVAEGTAPLSLNTQQPLRIGAGATEGPGDFFFPGMIDEVRIYNRALSADEVAWLAGRTQPLHKPF